MSVLKACRDCVKLNPFLYSVILEPIQRLRIRLPTKFGRHWKKRIDVALACPDNRHVTRVPEAGRIVRSWQIMHNGIKIWKGSYYNYPIQLLLQKNRGVHEPQEERAFGQVLQDMPRNAVMLELGAYWGFYSMWFHQVVESARCFLIEPVGLNLESGKRNFRLNGMGASFHQAFVGSSSGTTDEGVRRICIDDFLRENSIDYVHILHSDIQGFELEMLKGAREAIEENRIALVFVSTHSNVLHQECRVFLSDHGFTILASANLDESYSCDGLLVAKGRGARGPESLAISLRTPSSKV